MDDRQRRFLIGGAILILLGLGLYIIQSERWTVPSISFVIGVLFIASYLYTRSFELLIPGGILSGIGLGKLGGEIPLGISDFGGVGLGIGFAAITVIHLLYARKLVWWPLIPSFFLIFGGILSGSRDVNRWLSRNWPLLFVLAGVAVVGFGLLRRGKGAPPGDDTMKPPKTFGPTG